MFNRTMTICATCGADGAHLYPYWTSVLCQSCVDARLAADRVVPDDKPTMNRSSEPEPIISADGIAYRFPQFGRVKHAELIGIRPGVHCVGELLEVSSLEAIRDRFDAQHVGDNFEAFDKLLITNPGDLRPIAAVSSSRTVWLASAGEGPIEFIRRWCDEFDRGEESDLDVPLGNPATQSPVSKAVQS